MTDQSVSSVDPWRNLHERPGHERCRKRRPGVRRALPHHLARPPRQHDPARAPSGARERRDAILAAALDEFSARGFAATRLEDVAKRANVAKGTIYLYFADKETLFQELVRSMLSPLVGALERPRTADVPLPRKSTDHRSSFSCARFSARGARTSSAWSLTEGPRFPKLAEFYYREVIERVRWQRFARPAARP